MKLTDKDLEQLTEFWEDGLSVADRATVEKRLRTDTAYRMAAQKWQLLNESLEVVRQRKRRKRLEALDAELPPIPPPSTSNWSKIIVAAVVLTIAAISLWYAFSEEDVPVYDGPIAAYFEPYPAIGIRMGDTPDERKKEALVLYAQKQYAKAIPLLKDSFMETQDSMLLFYTGVSQLAIGQSKKAQLVFEQLKNTETVPQEATQWYLALAYVANKQYAAAITIIKNNPSSSYKDKMKLLLEEIAGKK